jgi:lysophospholipase L1-like esterase
MVPEIVDSFFARDRESYFMTEIRRRPYLVSFIFALCIPIAGFAQSTRTATTGPVPSATQPSIRPTELNRHEDFLATAHKGNIDLLFLGDSITDFWRRPDRGLTVWQKYFEPLHAANFGISGDRTQNVLWRVQNGELEGFKAKCIVLMLGTNNLSGGHSIRNSNAETIAGMKLVVGEIRARQPQAKLLLLGIFERGRTAADPFRASLKTVNAELATWADGKNIFYMDIGDKFLLPDGSLNMDIMNDPVHPNTAGYQVWADAIIDKVKELLAMPQ